MAQRAITCERMLFYVKEEPCETVFGRLKVECVQGADKFHLKCLSGLGDFEVTEFASRSVRWKVPVTKEQVEGALNQFRQATIPVYPEFPIGCDGTVYELGLGGYMGGTTFQWWSVLPPGWEVLVQVFTTVVAWADADSVLAKKRRR